MKRIIGIVLGIVLILVFIIGCGSKTEPPYAGALTDNVLNSINDGNYDSFSRDLDQVMQDAFTEVAFDGMRSQLQDKIGDYISKQFNTVVVQDEYTTVVYFAKYSKEDKVKITISFSAADGQNLVSGLYFDAPALR